MILEFEWASVTFPPFWWESSGAFAFLELKSLAILYKNREENLVIAYISLEPDGMEWEYITFRGLGSFFWEGNKEFDIGEIE